jgi:hypothetical protein
MPLSDEQVDAFNVYQVVGNAMVDRPHTKLVCPKGNASPHVETGGALGLLVAYKHCLVCCSCDYTQKLVYEHMVQPQPAAEGSLDEPGYAEQLIFLKNHLQAFSDEADKGNHMGNHMMVKSLSARLSALADRFVVNGPKIEIMPAMLLIQIHNMADPGSSVRHIIRGFMAAENVRRERQHWMGALFEGNNGDLIFDNAVYEQTVWRGKQETYYKGVKEHFEKMQNSLGFVSHFQEMEDAPLLKQDSNTQPLFPIRELDEGVVRLKALQPQVKALLGMMSGGSLDSMLLSMERPQIAGELEAD